MVARSDGLPQPAIKLDGFPLCPKCDREVNIPGEFCAMHGGAPLHLDGLRRSILRQLRSAVYQMMRCKSCADLKLNEIRCPWCTWLRGAAMGICGIAEELGWYSDVLPYLKMIGNYDPGWQERAQKLDR